MLVAGCAGTDAGPGCDPQALHEVRLARAGGTEVTLCGTVLSAGHVRRSRSGVHRIFFIAAGDREGIEVDANLAVLGDFPIRRGERTVIRGEYYYDGPGRDGVHWTHRTQYGNHPAGFIELDGTTYR